MEKHPEKNRRKHPFLPPHYGLQIGFTVQENLLWPRSSRWYAYLLERILHWYSFRIFPVGQHYLPVGSVKKGSDICFST